MTRLMNGGTIDTDSGADGYDGVQGNDPAGRGDVPTPVSGQRVLDLANEPFIAKGLKRPTALPCRGTPSWGTTTPRCKERSPMTCRAGAGRPRACLGSVKINGPRARSSARHLRRAAPIPPQLPAVPRRTSSRTPRPNPTSVGTTIDRPAGPGPAARQQAGVDRRVRAGARCAERSRVLAGITSVVRTTTTTRSRDARATRSSVAAFHYIVLDGNPRGGSRRGQHRRLAAGRG